LSVKKPEEGDASWAPLTKKKKHAAAQQKKKKIKQKKGGEEREREGKGGRGSGISRTAKEGKGAIFIFQGGRRGTDK